MSEKTSNLLFEVRKWRRYHERRSTFYAHCNFWMKLGIIAFATTPLYGLTDVWAWFAFAPVVASLIAVFDVVWKPAELGRDHHDMYRSFSDLETEIETSDFSDGLYNDWIKKRKNIEMGAKSRYRALEAYCHNEVARVTEEKEPRVITKWQRITMNIRPHPHGIFRTYP